MAERHRALSDRAGQALAERLRSARDEKGLSVRALAKEIGVSPSLISAIELGRAQPSAATLYAIAAELELSIDELIFGEPRHAPAPVSTASGTADLAPNGDGPPSGAWHGPVQRADSRREITLDSGVTWQRLTPEHEPGIDFLHTIYAVDGVSDRDHAMARHAGHEWGLVLSGRLETSIGSERYELDPGDSVSFESSTPHLLRNIGEEPVHAVWFALGRDLPAAGRTVVTEPTEPVQRADTRAEITLASGVRLQRLTAENEPDAEFTYAVYDAGGASSTDNAMVRRPAHEWGIVLSGRLAVSIAFERYELGPGDSISFDAMTPHLIRNAGDEPAHAVWFALTGDRRPVVL